jgi:hypothetical protein
LKSDACSPTTAHKDAREYGKRGDTAGEHTLRKHGFDAIDGGTIHGKRVKDWIRYATGRNGDKSCAIAT